MKRVLSISLLLLFLLPQLTKVWIYIDFKINQDYIASVLCVNKAAPLELCSGKCYLTDQLEIVDRQTRKELPNSLKDKYDIKLFYADFKANPRLNITQKSKHSVFPDLTSFIPNAFIHRVFHPPKFRLLNR